MISGGGPAPDSSHSGKNRISPTAIAPRAVRTVLPSRNPMARNVNVLATNATAAPPAEAGSAAPNSRLPAATSTAAPSDALTRPTTTWDPTTVHAGTDEA